MARRYWLMKSEPEAFSLDDLEKSPKKTTFWSGVRNFQARNFLRDDIAVGDGVIFYHSNANPSAAVGICSVVRAGYPDPTQFDAKNEYYDPSAKKDDPRWFVVDVRYEARFKRPISLEELREVAGLEDMVLLKRSRLSVQPVTPEEWTIICRLGGVAPGR